MGEPLPEQVLDTAVDPTEIVQQSFDTERRGFDQRQVQQYLKAVADSLHDAQQREADMRTRLGRAVRRAEAAEKALREAPSHDAAELNREFGEQVTAILEAARVTGQQRVSAAEKSAAQLLASAKADAAKMRAQAESVLKNRSAQAEVAAADILSAGRADAQSARDQGRADAAEMLAKAADRVQRARDECDGLIREAEEARAQILEDMERRRRQARAQVERLRVGRDRLLRSYEVVRRTLEETTVELKSSLKEAKVRGDGAARAVTSEPLATRDQLEAELRDAKMIGRITISDPGPAPDRIKAERPLRSPALPRPLSSQEADERDEAATPSAKSTKPRVSEAMKRGALSTQPKAPAKAPELTASTTEPPEDPIAVMMAAAEAKQAGTAAPVPAGPVAEADAPHGDDDAAVDAELAELEDKNLSIVDPSDDIEQVVAMPVDGATTDAAGDDVAAPGLFAALRAQRSDRKQASSSADKPAPEGAAEDAAAGGASAAEVEDVPSEAASDAKSKAAKSAPKPATSEAAKPAPEPATSEAAKPGPKANKPAETVTESQTSTTKTTTTKTAKTKAAKSNTTTKAAKSKTTKTKAAKPKPSGDADAASDIIPGLEAQRDAVIADAAKQLEKRLKRALADEQNDVLAGIRAAKRRVELTAIVGDVDAHINRYVLAIHEVAAITYGAGAALVDAEAAQGSLPAGAVEELLETDVVTPIRQRLASLDDLDVDAADVHVDPVRAFYRQRKTDHLGMAASRLANLLCVAGLCDALPQDAPLPWTGDPK